MAKATAAASAKEEKKNGKNKSAAEAGKAEAGKKAEKKPEVATVGSKELASRLGIQPATLRRWLRSRGTPTTDEMTRYEWKEGSKELKQVIADFQKYQDEQNAPKEDKKASKKASKKGAKAADREDEADDFETVGDEEETEEE